MIIPSATYRIQLSKNFTFSQLNQIIPYLNQLGVSTIYASPVLQAIKESEHGYGVTNPDVINPEIGTPQEMEKLTIALRALGISWLQDIVPNHMAFDADNYRLMDVLERGRNSSYAGYFDIDWEHPYFKDKLAVPFIGEPLEEALAQQKITVEWQDGLWVKYSWGNRYPLNLKAYELLIKHLPDAPPIPTLQQHLTKDYKQWQQAKAAWVQQFNHDAVQEALEYINASEQKLSALLQEQHFVLITEKESTQRLNYRRFFTINSLICLRMEEQWVFDDYHRYIHQLYKKGWIQGLRIDHIDGLKDPEQYINRLHNLFGKSCYIIAEKILEVKEALPQTLDIQGTSGYEFLSYINQVITDTKGAQQLFAYYAEQVPEFADYEKLVFEKKRSYLETFMNGEWDNLLRLLLKLKVVNTQDIDTDMMKQALATWMAALPQYRLYINRLPVKDSDTDLLNHTLQQAIKRMPQQQPALQQIHNVFVQKVDEQQQLQFIQKLMQLTGPLAAKGIEDTVFYLYNPLISHNEVGDAPCVLGIPIHEFHHKMIERHQKNPLSLNNTSTHDTKRGEDARIRINIISEMPGEWTKLVQHWQQLHQPLQQQVGNMQLPLFNDAYFFYQALLGGYPESLQTTPECLDRTTEYLTKAMRESRLVTSHLHPHQEYENANLSFIRAIYQPSSQFTQTLLPFLQKVIEQACIYTLVQVAIKMTAPGIPDVYQGCELWDLSYADPDNRRKVNFNLRMQMLQQLQQLKQNPAALLQWAEDNKHSGAQKLLVTHLLMDYRKHNKEFFVKAEYVPLQIAVGERLLLGYMRHYKNSWMLVLLPLNLLNRSQSVWQKLRLKLPPHAPQQWRNLFTGQTVNTVSQPTLPSLVQTFPIAVLVSS
jgi:(1->4)-alpha-D-glucan 1-alpha-D-glucosylmutase